MIHQLKQELNQTVTTNGAAVYKSTLNPCLDFMALTGAMRNRSEQDIIKLLSKSYEYEPLTTLKLVFFLADIREGVGERRLFKICIKWLAKNHADSLLKNLELIPYYTRWDYLYELVDIPETKERTLDFMKHTFEQDLTTDNPSLLAKWLKSENTSSSESKRLATITRLHFGLTSREYRKLLSKLRRQLNVVETKMSANKWSEINYEQVPSKASLLYRNAFHRNDFERYDEYLCDLNTGSAKVNAKVLFPYELVENVLTKHSCNPYLLNSMWDNLPDYLKGNSSNALAVVDVSGSMCGTPMNVAISLGLYLAEKNEGMFKNHFITFSEQPELVEIQGETFVDKVRFIEQSNWGFNTNLHRVFNLILKTATKYNLPQSEIPETLYIISDMQFDSACGYETESLLKIIEKSFHRVGYQMPYIVYWNVDAKLNTIPVMSGEYSLVSGFSPVLFEQTIRRLSALEVMYESINKPRYDLIKL